MVRYMQRTAGLFNPLARLRYRGIGLPRAPLAVIPVEVFHAKRLCRIASWLGTWSRCFGGGSRVNAILLVFKRRSINRTGRFHSFPVGREYRFQFIVHSMSVPVYLPDDATFICPSQRLPGCTSPSHGGLPDGSHSITV